MLDIIIGLISGAVGGNVAGAAMKENSLGTIGNSIAGIVGGGAGAGILQALGYAIERLIAEGAIEKTAETQPHCKSACYRWRA